MPNKSPDLETQLAALNLERTELDAAIEEMIADMAEVAPEQRSAGDWAPNGVLTKRFLELTNRQGEVEKEIVTISRDILIAAKPTLPN